MDVIQGTTRFAVYAALQYEDGTPVNLNALARYALWVRSGRGRYKGAPTVTDAVNGRLSFILDAEDLSLKRGDQVTWQWEIKLAGGEVVWTDADVLYLVPRS